MERSRLEDERDVRQVVVRVVHFIDRRRWDELRALFSDVVRTDYTSLVGGEAEETPADALLRAWRRRLEPLDATQHLLGPADVEVEGDEAVARCHVRAYHVARGAPGGPEWMIAGHYVFALARAPGGFRVRSMTLEASYQTGNAALLIEARALGRGPGAPR